MQHTILLILNRVPAAGQSKDITANPTGMKRTATNLNGSQLKQALFKCMSEFYWLQCPYKKGFLIPAQGQFLKPFLLHKLKGWNWLLEYTVESSDVPSTTVVLSYNKVFKFGKCSKSNELNTP